MPSSIRELALVAVETALAGLDDFALIKRNWSGEPTPDEMPTAVLFDGGEEPGDIRSGALQITLGFDVVIHCATGSADSLGPEISERLAQVKQLLMADWTLGGAVTEVRYRGAGDPYLDEDRGGSPMASIAARFELLISHSETDPYLERNG